MNYRGILLASFGVKDQIDNIITSIATIVNIPKTKIFTFKVTNCLEEEYVFTYNIDPEHANIEYSKIHPGTISVHRKKETNTLFTINAMNEVIKIKNRGHLDPSFNIKWSEFENTLLIVKHGKLRVLRLQLIRLNK